MADAVADVKRAARERVEQARDELVALSHRIHANPELGFEEEQACAWLCELLRVWAAAGQLRAPARDPGAA